MEPVTESTIHRTHERRQSQRLKDKKSSNPTIARSDANLVTPEQTPERALSVHEQETPSRRRTDTDWAAVGTPNQEATPEVEDRKAADARSGSPQGNTSSPGQGNDQTRYPRLDNNESVTAASAPDPSIAPAAQDASEVVAAAGSSSAAHNLSRESHSSADNQGVTGSIPLTLAASDLEHVIRRVLDEANNDPVVALGVDRRAPVSVIAEALRTQACALKTCDLERKEEASKTLFEAAAALGVPQPYLQEVRHWQGGELTDYETIVNEVAEGGPEEEGDTDDDRMSDVREYVIPMPPDAVKGFYARATPLLKQMLQNPHREDLKDELMQLNAMLSVIPEQKMTDHKWEIPVSFFRTHYGFVSDYYRILRTNPISPEACHGLDVEKALIDNMVDYHHLPVEWRVRGPGEFLETLGADGTVEGASGTNSAELDDGKRMTRAAQQGASDHNWGPDIKIDYPWDTMDRNENERIIGFRRQGFGRQFCIEIKELGSRGETRYVRKLVPGSKIGQELVGKYEMMPNCKVLSQNQNTWSAKDKGRFVDLIWITDSRIETAKRKSTKCPPADCCVRFRSGDNESQLSWHILTASSLYKVLGRAEGAKQIRQICERDRIVTPWDAIKKSLDDNTEQPSVHSHADSARQEVPWRRRLDSNSYPFSNSGPDPQQTQINNLQAQLNELMSILRTGNFQALARQAQGTDKEEDLSSRPSA